MLRQAVKSAAYATGALGTYHRLRNAHTLTVLMFHRVLPAAERDAAQADPLWTISAELFEIVLAFLRRHYNLVTLNDIMAARMRHAALPRRALLITFDDGWRDNLDYALPLLRRFAAPAAIFAASDAIEQSRTCWWQDVVSWALRSGRKSTAELWREAGFLMDQRHDGVEPELRLLLRYGELASSRRDELLRPLARELEQRQQRAQMVNPASLRELAAAGIGIGVHGASHLPLTELSDPAADLAQARERIALHTGEAASASLSFPHGRYDERVVGTARRLGFKLLFTSDPVVNSCPGGWLELDLLGRIPIFSQIIGRAGERLSGSALAPWLFVRPRKILASDDSPRGQGI